MHINDVTRVADEVASAAVSTVNDSLVTAAREGERLAARATSWFERLVTRLAPRSTSRSQKVVVVAIAIGAVVALWMLVRRAQQNAVDDGKVESLAPPKDQQEDAGPARRAS